MAIVIKHQGHIYSFSHPLGWSGGDPPVRHKLNEFQPAGEYPIDEAEEKVLRHALAGILAGGEIVEAGAKGQAAPGAKRQPIADGISTDAPIANPERILEGDVGDEPADPMAADPDRILEG